MMKMKKKVMGVNISLDYRTIYTRYGQEETK